MPALPFAPKLRQANVVSLVNATGTATAGAATTITLAAGSSAVNSFYNGMAITILSGTGAGQSRTITGYVGSTRVATVATWGTNPDNTSVYAITPVLQTATTAAASGAINYDGEVLLADGYAHAKLRLEHATAADALTAVTLTFANLSAFGFPTPLSLTGAGANSEILQLFPIYTLTNPASLTGLGLGTGAIARNSGSTGYNLTLTPAAAANAKVILADFSYKYANLA